MTSTKHCDHEIFVGICIFFSSISHNQIDADSVEQEQFLNLNVLHKSHLYLRVGLLNPLQYLKVFFLLTFVGLY